MSPDELRGTKLTPNAVAPGEFQDHMRGMQRGDSGIRPTTRPDLFGPTTQPGILSIPWSVPHREPAGGGEPGDNGGGAGGGQPIFVPVPVPAGGNGG